MSKKRKEKRAAAEPGGSDAQREETPATAPAAEQTPDVTASLLQRDRLEEQLKRAMADLANIRKRRFKEMDEVRRRAIEGLVHELLPVLDNFHLALAAHAHQEENQGTRAMVEGLEMVRGLLEDVLERHGVAEIPASGVSFDPNLHEAVGIDPTTGIESGRISRVIQRGYRFEERVIRPSKVIVAGPLEESHEATQAPASQTPESQTPESQTGTKADEVGPEPE